MTKKIASRYFAKGAIKKTLSVARSSNDPHRIVYLNPKTFAQMAKPTTTEGGAPEKVATVASLVEAGTPFTTLPYLKFKHDGKGRAKVIGHEGRHRCAALAAKGVKRVPVVLIAKDCELADAYTWNSNHLRPTTLIGEGRHRTNSIDFPVSEDDPMDKTTAAFDATITGRLNRMLELAASPQLQAVGAVPPKASGGEIKTPANPGRVLDQIGILFPPFETLSREKMIALLKVNHLESLHVNGALASKLDDYNRAFVEPIVDKASALSAYNSYTLDMFLSLTLSLSQVDSLIAAVNLRLERYGVHPSANWMQPVSENSDSSDASDTNAVDADDNATAESAL